jgi:hypothetical protein
VRFSLLLAAILVVAGVGGCYSPGIKNKGFSCSPDVEPPCPSGFYCVDGLCQNKPGTSSGVGGVAADAGSAADMATTIHGGDFDFALPPDLTMVPPDMTRVQCRPAATPCLVDEDCCSKSCTTLFGCE